jgi:hypothetical protein
MRVVNKIEKEMIQSEWENWLADENLRCEQIKMMLSEKASSSSASGKATPSVAGVGGDGQKVMRPIDEKRVEALTQWHAEYCGSCKLEKDMALAKRMKMVDV